MRRTIARLRLLWHILGPWGDNMDDKPTPRHAAPIVVVVVPGQARSIGHIEADLIIQGVLVARARERKSHQLANERARLDALIDEWAAARRTLPA